MLQARHRVPFVFVFSEDRHVVPRFYRPTALPCGKSLVVQPSELYVHFVFSDGVAVVGVLYASGPVGGFV